VDLRYLGGDPATGAYQPAQDGRARAIDHRDFDDLSL
jgi:hypothetical protein